MSRTTYDSDLDSRILRRARSSMAHAAAQRAQALAEGYSERRRQRLDRAERHTRKAYLETLRLADLAEV